MTISDIQPNISARDADLPGVCVYTTPTCVICPSVIKAIRDRGYEPTIVDITEDQTAFRYVNMDLGYKSVPVVAVQAGDGLSTWHGRRPDMLVALLPKVGEAA